MGNTTFGIENAKLSVVLVGFGSAVLVITIYHCLAMGWCRPGGHRGDSRSPRAQQRRQRSLRHDPNNMLELSSLESSIAQLIPAYKYQKGLGLVDEDGMCSICLSQFEEGEELRTLPECLHSYHAPCIDMWLYSHSSCPMCRTDMTPSPSPQIFCHYPPDSSSGQPDSGSVRVDSGMLRTVIVQSRT